MSYQCTDVAIAVASDLIKAIDIGTAAYLPEHEITILTLIRDHVSKKLKLAKKHLKEEEDWEEFNNKNPNPYDDDEEVIE